MNRRLFLAALVSAISSRFFPQRTTAHQYVESRGTTKLTGSLSWGVNQWRHGSILLREGDFADGCPRSDQQLIDEIVRESSRHIWPAELTAKSASTSVAFSPGRENSTLRFTDQFSVDPKWHSGNGDPI